MHHHGGMAGGGGTAINILPLWVQVVWVLLLAAVTAMHLLTLGFARARAQVWTGAHTLMGAGMLYMYLPWSSAPPIPDGAFVAVFAGLTVVGLLGLAGDWNEGRPVRMMWVLVTVDLAAMAYMFSLAHAGVGLLTYALAGWYAALAIVWSSGVPDSGLTTCCAVPFGLERPIPPLPLARAAQVAMTVGMAWMFLAMDPKFGAHLAKAFDGGLNTPAWYLIALGGLLLRFGADPALVRGLAGPIWESVPAVSSVPAAAGAVTGGPGALYGGRDVDAAGLLYTGGLQFARHVPQDVTVDLLVHSGQAAQQVRP
jgi:hypothetical protein